MNAKHPMQPVVKRSDGTPMFKENKIVSFLLDYSTGKGIGLNEICRMPFAAEDYEQLMQLIGYTVGGYDELSMVSDASKNLADKAAKKLK